MAKLEMKWVSLYALREDRKVLIEQLQLLGMLEIETGETPTDGFFREDMEARATAFERSEAVAVQALGILDAAVPEKKGMLASLSGRRELTVDAFTQETAKNTQVLQACHEAVTLQKKKLENLAELSRLQVALAQLEPWAALDVSMRFAGTQTTCAFVGAFPGVYTAEQLTERLARQNTDLLFDMEILNTEKEQTCVFLMGCKTQTEKMEQALRALGFSRPSGAVSGLPRDKKQELLHEQKTLQLELTRIEQEIIQLADKRRDMEVIADYFHVRAEKYRVIGQLDHTCHTFMVTGYMPALDVPQLKERLYALCGVVIEVEDADPEKAPVKLKNNAFVAPAESITDMYALPLASDIDPTPVFSFFYYFFFGMMLADVGYGLLLTFGAFFLLKKYKPEANMRRNLKLFMYCGIAAVFWGVMFGSYFGDAIPVISEAMFGTRLVIPPLLFDPMEGAVGLLVLSIALGFVQIMVGLGAKFYVQWRTGDHWGAVFDAGFWMTALLGAALLAAGGWIAPIVSTIGVYMAIGSAIGLVLTQGRSKKGPMKLFSGIASLYDVTGYVSDLMSYSRLMALGLTGAAMASVFNMLSVLVGKSVIGVLVMILLFTIGHGISFGLNVLGAYVHTIRLQYVELFSKFYEGGGRVFHPFAFCSQYIRIREETKQ